MMRQDKTKAKMQKARETLKQNLTSIISLAAVLLAAAATIAMPEITRKGVSNGLSICGSIIIPSLFPFMVISSFLVESGAQKFWERYLSIRQNTFSDFLRLEERLF